MNQEDFWQAFYNQDFQSCHSYLAQVSDEEKCEVLSGLYQQSCFAKKPIMLSVLRRELQAGKTFDDFYQAWLPDESMRNPIEQHGQVYQQHFPSPVRVINAVNIQNENDIISVGICWVANELEAKALWDYVETAMQGGDANNEARHEKIQQETNGGLLGVYRVASDDNLGTPF
jgi:hypothetical protein